MLDQIIEEKVSIDGIALRSGGGKALAVVGQAGGMHGEQHQVGILGKHGNHRAARLFQSDSHSSAAKALSQFCGPDLGGFGGVVELAARLLAVAVEHAPIVFLVGPVQADAGCEFWSWRRCRRWLYGLECGHVLVRLLKAYWCKGRQDLVSTKAL